MKELASNIRMCRMKLKMTQAQLADKIGVQAQTVSKWETGTSVPDALMLPMIADALDVSIDELFGRRGTGCAGSIPDDRAVFLLQTYSQMYAPEAGPWNLSVENKYLEYRFREFFEKHFAVSKDAQVCNIGIGAGEWDTYLSYKLPEGTLTSVDRIQVCCRQLQERLLCEGNPNKVTVVCADVMTLDFREKFDFLTIVGSTAAESGDSSALIAKASTFVKTNGSIYYQTLDEIEDCNAVIQTAFQCGMALAAFAEDDAYGFRARYYKFDKLR